MANNWASAIPVVNVPAGSTKKQVTLVVPYYQSAKFLETQAAVWRTYPYSVSIVVVDDGSPEPAKLPSGLDGTARLFRIDQDVPWNWLAARNIGAHHAQDGWLLLTDMDHVVPVETMCAALHGQHDPTVVYGFSRREHTGAPIQPHSASFLMTRQMFWAIGGYDEALSGHYGTDGVYRKEIRKHAPMRILSDVLVRYEYVDDSSTSTYQRKLPRDTAAVKSLVAARPRDWTPRVLSFPYHEVVR
jgi:hypothetical protein